MRAFAGAGKKKEKRLMGSLLSIQNTPVVFFFSSLPLCFCDELRIGRIRSDLAIISVS